jgi:hypothetical protein
MKGVNNIANKSKVITTAGGRRAWWWQRLGLVAHKLQATNKGTTHLGNSADELHRLPEEMAVYCTNMINNAIFEVQLGIW